MHILFITRCFLTLVLASSVSFSLVVFAAEDTEFCQVVRKVVAASSHDFQDVRNGDATVQEDNKYWLSTVKVSGGKTPRIWYYGADKQYAWVEYMLPPENPDVRKVFDFGKQSIRSCLGTDWSFRERVHGKSEELIATSANKPTVVLSLDSNGLFLTISKDAE